MKKTAIILVNLGTPETPTKEGVSAFLKNFLSDTRVVEAPKLIWWFVLRCIIIPLRAKKVASAYQKIWWDEGSPIRVISQQQVLALQQKIDNEYKDIPKEHAPKVEMAVTYGFPSIKETIKKLEDGGYGKFVVIPMYPQYSGSTTGAIYDQLAELTKGVRNVPEVITVKEFYDHPKYISALTETVKAQWQQNQRSEKLLMSFHGIPQEYVDKGDPYHYQCTATAKALAVELGLKDDDWAIGFQSRFGPKKWLQPYIDNQLKNWVDSGISSVDIISPAFTADCLETLEELDIGYREFFMEKGGKKYNYIPCLNDSALFIESLFDLVKPHLK